MQRLGARRPAEKRGATSNVAVPVRDAETGEGLDLLVPRWRLVGEAAGAVDAPRASLGGLRGRGGGAGRREERPTAARQQQPQQNPAMERMAPPRTAPAAGGGGGGGLDASEAALGGGGGGEDDGGMHSRTGGGGGGGSEDVDGSASSASGGSRSDGGRSTPSGRGSPPSLRGVTPPSAAGAAAPAVSFAESGGASLRPFQRLGGGGARDGAAASPPLLPALDGGAVGGGAGVGEGRAAAESPAAAAARRRAAKEALLDPEGRGLYGHDRYAPPGGGRSGTARSVAALRAPPDVVTPEEASKSRAALARTVSRYGSELAVGSPAWAAVERMRAVQDTRNRAAAREANRRRRYREMVAWVVEGLESLKARHHEQLTLMVNAEIAKEAGRQVMLRAERVAWRREALEASYARERSEARARIEHIKYDNEMALACHLADLGLLR